MNNITVTKKGISILSNVASFFQRATGCSEKQAEEVASLCKDKFPETAFSCVKYDGDKILLGREYKGCLLSQSIMGANIPAAEKFDRVRQFLAEAAAENAYHETFRMFNDPQLVKGITNCNK